MTYSVINRSAINLSEVVLVLGCDASDTRCLEQAAGQLKAAVLIYGIVAREGDQYRLTIELFDADARRITHRLSRVIPATEDLTLAYRLEIEEFFRSMRDAAKRAHLIINANVRGARVSLNGEEAGTTPFERQGLEPGSYAIEVAQDGFAPWRVELALEAGNTLKLSATLKRQVAHGARTAPSDSPLLTTTPSAGTGPPLLRAERSPSQSIASTNWGAWSLIGVGGVALIASGVSALLMFDVEDELRRRQDRGNITLSEREQLISQGERYETTHRVALGVGLVSAVGGVIWLLASGGDETPRVEAPVQLHLTGRGAAVQVRW